MTKIELPQGYTAEFDGSWRLIKGDAIVSMWHVSAVVRKAYEAVKWRRPRFSYS